jgi:hypothetical protein
MSGYGKRSRLVFDRGGIKVSELYWVCYSCPAELSEAATLTHKCEGVNYE